MYGVKNWKQKIKKKQQHFFQKNWHTGHAEVNGWKKMNKVVNLHRSGAREREQPIWCAGPCKRTCDSWKVRYRLSEF